MTRVVSVYLPTWSTDRFRRRSEGASLPPEQPIVLVGTDGRRRVVIAADNAAQRAGVLRGMPATKAQVLVPGLLVETADPDGDTHALDRLAFWALRYSPVAAADPPDGLVIDIEGASHLVGSEQTLLSDITSRLGASGFDARVAVADCWAPHTQ